MTQFFWSQGILGVIEQELEMDADEFISNQK